MKLPYNTTIDEFTIINEGNINEYLNKSIIYDVSNKDDFIKIFEAKIKGSQEKLILNLNLNVTNEGSGAEINTHYYNLVVRFIKYNSIIKARMDYLPFSMAYIQPKIYLVVNKISEDDLTVKIYVSTEDTYSRINIKNNFIYPITYTENLKNYKEIVSKTEMDEIIKLSDYNIKAKNVLSTERTVFDYDLIPQSDNTVAIGKINKGLKKLYCKRILKIPYLKTTDYETEELDGNAIIIVDSSSGKIMWWNNSTQTWIPCTGNSSVIDIPCLASKPTSGLKNGMSFFHTPTKQIMTYYEGEWYSNGNLV